VTTHGEIDVAKFFARKGPKGWYSHVCISLALQSLTNTIPNICSFAFSTEIDSLNLFPVPIKNPVSSSKSISLQGPNTGAGASVGLVCPLGRTISVPLTTTELALP